MGIDYVGTEPDRRPTPKRHGPSVGTLVDPFRRARYGYLSEPERALLTLLASLRGVLRIHEQRKVPYQLGSDRRTVHW